MGLEVEEGGTYIRKGRCVGQEMCLRRFVVKIEQCEFSFREVF